MKPIKFAEVNITFAKDQPEYQPLPAFRDPGPEGAVISCWRLSWRERIKLLFTGKLWLSLWSFHKPLTPSLPTVNKSDVLITKKIKTSTANAETN
jgi:hypothetical protein